jgi:hypothetical protein
MFQKIILDFGIKIEKKSKKPHCSINFSSRKLLSTFLISILLLFSQTIFGVFLPKVEKAQAAFDWLTG